MSEVNDRELNNTVFTWLRPMRTVVQKMELNSSVEQPKDNNGQQNQIECAYLRIDRRTRIAEAGGKTI